MVSESVRLAYDPDPRALFDRCRAEVDHELHRRALAPIVAGAVPERLDPSH